MSDPTVKGDDPFAGMSVSKVLSYVGLQAVFFTLIGVALWRLAGQPEFEFVTRLARM